MIVPDKKLFAIVLYSAFVIDKFLIPDRDIWERPWVVGTASALAIGLVGAIVAPLILIAIIYGLGFTAEGVAAGSFAAWFMSLYEGTIEAGSIVAILQSIGATGSLGALGISISSGFGAAIGILIGAIGGSNLAKYLREMDLNDSENKILENFVQTDEHIYQNNGNTIDIFTLMPALLYNDLILECFIKTFISSSPFANSELFRFNFKDNLSKLKSEEERVNHTIYNLLIDNYNKSRIEYIFHDDTLVGYNLDLSGYKPSDPMINTLVEIWSVINGNVYIEYIDKIRDQIDQIDHKIRDRFDQMGHKVHDQIDQIKYQIHNSLNHFMNHD